MELKDAIRDLDSLDGEDMIYARRPWTSTSECVIIRYPQNAREKEAKDAGLVYFLEGGTAREVLEVFEGRETTLDERIRLLVHYAEWDAFPDWAYQN